MPRNPQQPSVICFNPQEGGKAKGGDRRLGTKGNLLGAKGNLLGAKGTGLVQIAGLGAPMPPGCVLTNDLTQKVSSHKNGLPRDAQQALKKGLGQLEDWTGRRLGGNPEPLLLSVRSSPPLMIPGLMPTVHAVGLTLKAVPGLGELLDDPRSAWDAYRRLVQSYGIHVLHLDADGFDRLFAEALEAEGAEAEHELSAEAMESLAREFDRHCAEQGQAMPQDPQQQLAQTVDAAFRSWNDPRAVEYRGQQALEDLPGTAVVVQESACGTRAGESGAGSFTTRSTATGEQNLYGQFLPIAQVADLTAGTRLTENVDTLAKSLPKIHEQLETWAQRLERHFQDAVQIQFIVDRGTLNLVGCESAPRTPIASLKIAVDLVDAGIASERQALRHVDPNVIEMLMHPRLDRSGNPEALTKGLPASPGSAVGRVVFFAEHAEEFASQDQKCILARHETTPEDIGGLNVAQGILTATGGLTSHAAVVARGMGKCCVVGAREIRINYHINEMTIGGTTIKKGDWISLDGNTGEVFAGDIPQVQPGVEGDLNRVLEWADANRTMGVFANADTAEDARRAVTLGAGGIGLCRTEHMFFQLDRIPIFRKMILAVDEVGRTAALAELLPLQRKDFMDIFREMDGKPVTIRLLDPPLNEFLPRGIRSQTRMSKVMDIPLEVLQQRTEALTENNPMLGHRGCRLAITYPEMYQMQVRAIVEAACIVVKEGVAVEPEIMVPLISTARELKVLRELTETLAERVMEEMGEEIQLKIGTMIETPRAAVCSQSIAPFADFYSFGTNDLTQMGFGFSRDDAGMFLPTYLERNILDSDPFVSLDREGIGAMVRMAVQEGRKANPGLKLGICGEHGGDPASIAFFHSVGLDYVSCSPFRIPVARLAAAQAEIEAEEG